MGRVKEEEVVLSIERLVHNLVSTGMSMEDVPALQRLIKEVSQRHFPEWDQTS